MGALKGKSVRKQPEAVRSNYVDLPRDILTRHQRIELAADIMFVNTIPFMVTISRHIMFTSAECLKSRKIDTIKDYSEEMYKLGTFAPQPIKAPKAR